MYIYRVRPCKIEKMKYYYDNFFFFFQGGGGDKIWKFDEHDKIASFEKLIFEKVKRNSISSKKILKIEIER